MSRIDTETSVEDAIQRSRHLTGSSRLVNTKIFPPQEIRKNRRIVTPRDFGLQGAHLTTAQLYKIIDISANLAELLQYVEDGLWDKYRQVAALGQMGQESINGRLTKFVPILWGAGSIHHVQVKNVNETWSDSDLFLVAS